MNNKQVTFSIFFLSIFLLAALRMNGAETNENISPTTWSYQECLNYAIEHNIDLRRELLTSESSKVDLEKAKAQWLPSLNLATTQGFTNYPKDNGNSYTGTYGLNASWTIYDGNSRNNNIKSSEIQTRINDYSIESVKNNLETQILSYYLKILYSKEAIEISKQALEVSKMQMERAEQLMKSGKLSRVDLSQIESQYHTDNYNLVSSQSNYSTNIMELKQLLMLGHDYNFELDSLSFSELLILGDLPLIGDVYSTAISWLPTFKSSTLQQEMKDYDIKSAKGGYYPSISLNAGVGTSNSTSNSGNFGNQLYKGLNEQISVTFSVPILDKKTNKSAVAKANIEKLNAVLEHESLENELSKTIESIFIEARSSQAKYVSGLEQVKSAQLTNDLTSEQFRLGLVNTLDLLTSHNNLLSAQQELLQSKYMAIISIKMIEFYEHKSITLP
ncbi:MAG: TolC family protein [Muribaculaceae bacterium]|nr:TolC family protein [Muribaculaceae bacterium]